MLARERLQMLAVSTGSMGEIAKDTGAIVLRPPTPKSAVAAVAAQTPFRPASPRMAGSIKPAGAGRGVALPAPGHGAPLRPMIVETSPQQQALVQLGAWRSEAEAREGWKVAQAGADGLLDGLQPIILRVDLTGRGTFYRLRTALHGVGAALCGALAAKGIACLPVRS